MIPTEEKSPWNIESLYNLQFFNCPSCIYKHDSKQDFICHAYDTHPESVDYLKNISDGSISDILCPWESNQYGEYEIKKEAEDPLEVASENESSGEYHQKYLDDEDENFDITENNKEIPNPFNDCFVPLIKLKEEDIFDADSQGVLIKHSPNDMIVDNDIKNKIIDPDWKFQDTKEPKRFMCDLCVPEKWFTRKLSLQKHISAFHEDKSDIDYEDPKKFKCEQCSASYTRRYLLTGHVNAVHEGKGHKCDVCEKVFPKIWDLNRHISSVHEEERPYVCQFCQSAYVDKRDLIKHVSANHQNDENEFTSEITKYEYEGKGHKCDMCEKIFPRIDNLRRHISSGVHGPHEYTCEICEKTFTKESNLAVHKKWKHNSETPDQFKCTLCDKAYDKRVGLKNHMHMKHGRGIDNENVKNIPCDKCDLLFNSNGALRQHKKWKHENRARYKTEPKVHPCELCNKICQSPQVLRDHIAR